MESGLSNFFVVIAVIGAAATFLFALITGALLLRVGRLEAINTQLRHQNQTLAQDNLELQISLKNLNEILIRFFVVEQQETPSNQRRDTEIARLLRELETQNRKVSVNIANVQGQAEQVIAGRDNAQIQAQAQASKKK